MRTKLTNEASIKQVIREMTLEEKMNLIITPTPCLSYAIEDMDIPSLILADGATGANGTHIMLDFLTDLMKQMSQMQERSDGANTETGNLWLELQELIGLEEKDAEK